MKRIFYHMACWLAVLGCAACSNETDFVKTEADNNSIVLDISSATTPVTRAGATGAEVTVSYVDVLIFDDILPASRKAFFALSRCPSSKYKRAKS